MDNQLMSATIVIISTIIVLPVLLIFKGVKVRLLCIFLAVFFIGQIIGYGMGIDVMKAVAPDCEKGFCYQYASSTILPFLIAFILDYAYDKSFRTEKKQQEEEI